MNQKITLFRPIFYVLGGICVVVMLLCAISSREIFFTAAGVVVLGLLYVFAQLRHAGRDIDEFLRSMGEAVGQLQTKATMHMPMPVFVVGENDEIVWYNQYAAALLKEGEELYGHPAGEVIGELDYRQPCPLTGHDIQFQGRFYSAYVNPSEEQGCTLYAIYLVEDTDLKRYAELYFKTKTAIMIVTIDNYDELVQSARESDRSQLLSEIEYQVEQYVERHGGILDRIERDRFVVYLEDQHMQEMIGSRFDILDTVRAISPGDRVPATLSIGVGREAKGLRESEQLARQALDMALGRGGDQAAVRTQNGYDFYGGLSKGVEKRTKVKTRIVATALKELIEQNENVIVMGHRFADLDAFGSAVGLYRAVRQLGKPASVAIDRKRHLVSPLFEQLEENGFAGAFVDPEMLMDKVGLKTLLIVVDTHIEGILESPELYRKCETVVVIDHHRKMVGHIDNAVIFYHEPYASSASEMVTELVQYFGDEVKMGRLEAEALLSGIMLDTKNFVLKTGVRTFEAAAYLRRLGADTVDVRKLFSSSMEAYQRRARLVAAAEIYRGCAVCGTNVPTEDIKIVVPQAADELLGISNVDASFVLYEADGEVSVSARSMGGLNVQIVMEKLGGGGHMTMAGAQIQGVTLEDARQRLLEAIDDYRDTNHQA